MERTWEKAIAAGLLAATASCGDQPNPADKPNCRLAEARLDACVRANSKKGGRALFLACVPYSKPQRIAGTWAGDFEFNVFFDGQEVSPERALSYPLPPFTLEGPPKLATDEEGVPQTTVKYITFDGRRPLCHFDPGPDALVVDRIVSERVLHTRPSAWFSHPWRN